MITEIWVNIGLAPGGGGISQELLKISIKEDKYYTSWIIAIFHSGRSVKLMIT